MLLAKEIKVRLGGTEILRGIDFTAAPGQFTAVIGPNGSGKTTLLRALTGEIGYAGEASLNDVDVRSAQPWRLAAMRAVLPQNSSLAFPFTVYEVVRLGLTAGIVGADAENLVGKALSSVDLEGFDARFYQELSGGEQQRVQLARALCQVWEPIADGVPCYLFLDEPVSSLDIKHQLQIMQIAADYARRGGGVLAVMHDLNLTALFADRVVLLNEGRLFAQGTPAEVLTRQHLEQVYDCPMRVGKDAGGMYLSVTPDVAAASVRERISKCIHGSAS